ncbi:hypothetical protein QR98_0050220 [Sarcoptes scabiei]|uniref:Uncharacterized protein n=1 Tax=Sarcoptes scabiei TaxID=52283 RepID=A0A132A7C9_SARSC|nr:hypothetical protein QR98_0050220 [Sarcoptes scabiei]
MGCALLRPSSFYLAFQHDFDPRRLVFQLRSFGLMGDETTQSNRYWLIASNSTIQNDTVVIYDDVIKGSMREWAELSRFKF